MWAYSNSSASRIYTISQNKTDRSANTVDSHIPQSMPKWRVTVAHHPDALAKSCFSFAQKSLGVAEVRCPCLKAVSTVADDNLDITD